MPSCLPISQYPSGVLQKSMAESESSLLPTDPEQRLASLPAWQKTTAELQYIQLCGQHHKVSIVNITCILPWAKAWHALAYAWTPVNYKPEWSTMTTGWTLLPLMAVAQLRMQDAVTRHCCCSADITIQMAAQVMTGHLKGRQLCLQRQRYWTWKSPRCSSECPWMWNLQQIWAHITTLCTNEQRQERNASQHATMIWAPVTH